MITIRPFGISGTVVCRHPLSKRWPNVPFDISSRYNNNNNSYKFKCTIIYLIPIQFIVGRVLPSRAGLEEQKNIMAPIELCGMLAGREGYGMQIDLNLRVWKVLGRLCTGQHVVLRPQ